MVFCVLINYNVRPICFKRNLILLRRAEIWGMKSMYITTSDLAKVWGVSAAWISTQCRQGRIDGAIQEHRQWRIPSQVAEGPKITARMRKRMEKQNARFRYIDLFAGIGGFHQAMRFLGGECLMAAEINEECIKTYELNFKTLEGKLRRDVNKIDPRTIAPFDVLCAGFPCQPFSKAGAQKGFEDERRGNLFYRIMDILDAHPEVKFLILENVRNLADKTENWDIITSQLAERNFYITEKPIILSPSDFGIPQIRERVYILGIRKDIRDETILTNGCIHIEDLRLDKYRKKCRMGDAWKILEQDVDDSYIVPAEQELMINAWDELRKATKIGLIGYPLWLDSFGVGVDDTEAVYAAQSYNDEPDWKQEFLRLNREFYLEHREFIDKWVEKYQMMTRIKLYKKFEWNCGTDVTDIHNCLLQIRQSGIRAKRPTFYPSLVAMVNTPIIWDPEKEHYRRITPREAANLQSFHQRYKLRGTDATQYRQLGNSVNVRVLKILGQSLFNLARPGWEDVD